jgi:membrane-associated protease RseP (regulator of RpoE activity)
MSGATISAFLMMIYVVSDWAVPVALLPAFMAFGFGAVLTAFVEAAIGRRRPLLHLVVNNAMIVGFFFLVVGMVEVAGNGVSGLLVVSFSFLWIDTRIQLSQWRHSIVCDECYEDCKAY